MADGDLVRRAKSLVDLLCPEERLARLCHGENGVEYITGDEKRPRRNAGQHVPLVGETQDVGRAFAHAADSSEEQAVEGVHRGGWHGRCDSCVQRCGVHRLIAATRGARDADSRRVDVRAGKQVVDSTHVVPDLQTFQGQAGRQQVERVVVTGEFPLAVAVLVDRKDHVAQIRQADAARLNLRLEAAVRPVSVGAKHGWVLLLAVFRHVDVAGHVHTRQTGVHELLNHVRAPVDFAGDPGIQVRFLEQVQAEGVPEFVADLLLPGANRLRLPRPVAAQILFESHAPDVIFQHVAVAPAQHAPVQGLVVPGAKRNVVLAVRSGAGHKGGKRQRHNQRKKGAFHGRFSPAFLRTDEIPNFDGLETARFACCSTRNPSPREAAERGHRLAALFPELLPEGFCSKVFSGKPRPPGAAQKLLKVRPVGLERPLQRAGGLAPNGFSRPRTTRWPGRSFAKAQRKPKETAAKAASLENKQGILLSFPKQNARPGSSLIFSLPRVVEFRSPCGANRLLGNDCSTTGRSPPRIRSVEESQDKTTSFPVRDDS